MFLRSRRVVRKGRRGGQRNCVTLVLSTSDGKSLATEIWGVTAVPPGTGTALYIRGRAFGRERHEEKQRRPP
jgi:hypothetical protein